MWARAKGRTENALLGLGLRGAHMFRLGVIQPLEGIVSKTKSYRMMYAVMGSALPLLKRLFPKHVTLTEELGRAMIAVSRVGYRKGVVEAGEVAGIAAA